MPANFSSPVCSPTGKAGKNAETGLCCVFTNCHYRKKWVAKNKISIYVMKANFLKIVAFKGTSRKFLNIVPVAFYIEGSRYLPICLFETPFSPVLVLLKQLNPLPRSQ
jgi:hypothetical protein